MGQAFNEGAQIIGRVKTAPQLIGQLRIEAVRTVLAFKPGQVIELALARSEHPFAGGHLSGHNIAGVLTGDAGVIASHNQPAMSAQGSRSSAASRGSVMREREAGVKPISVAALVMIWACLLAIAK